MTSDLNGILGQVGRDRGIDKQVVIEALESAMLSAAKKHFGHNLNLETRFNEESGEIEVVQFKTVVESVEDPDTQIAIADARREFDAEAMVGDELGKKLDCTALGRIAAQTAKQVINQKVRDAVRGVIYEEYKGQKGELINGIVLRYDRGDVIVDLGRTEAILPKREQISRERYRQRDRLRCMILDIDPTTRGPQIILTRSHPDFLKKLFALEVPEISEGIIEIKAVAREPGERAKIAVSSSDSGVDPVGACVGIKGSRVQAVVQELRGERIDIIPWTFDEPSFVARALAPAEVTRVVVDEDNHSMEVIVADDQLAQAIGRRGQNVKLASRLSGWRLDVRSVSVAEEEARRARASIEAIPGLQFTVAEQLFQEGYRSARDIADVAPEELAELDGITMEQAQEIVRSAKTHVLALEDAAGEEGSQEQVPVTDLDRLALSPELKDLLIRRGYTTIQSLVLANSDELLGVEGISPVELDLIRGATDSFFKSSLGSRLNRGESRDDRDRGDLNSI